MATASAAAFLAREGLVASLADLAVETLDADAVSRARLIAISVPMHTALRLGARAAEKIRQLNPRAHVTFFGVYAQLNADWLLDGRADSVIAGEPEEALVALARSVLGGEPLDVTGAGAAIAMRGRAATPAITRLGYLAPARATVPLARYAKAVIDGEERLSGAVEATRGCLHRCTHCPVPAVYDGRFFAVPVDVVLADVRALVDAGARHVSFADPDFWNGPAHARRVIEAAHAEFPDLTFDATIKIEHLVKHAEMLPALREAGCVFVVSAVESLSDRVLGILEKGHTRRDVQTALAAVRDAGIALRPSLLPFTPWSTLEDYADLLEWIAREDLADAVDPVQLSIRLLVPPGSLLETHPAFRPHRGALDREGLRWEWAHPDPRMDALAAQAAQIAADDARAGAPADQTFARLAEALRACGGSEIAHAHDARATDAKARRPRAPRLTEPWFC